MATKKRKFPGQWRTRSKNLRQEFTLSIVRGQLEVRSIYDITYSRSKEACEFIIHSGDKEFVSNRAAEMLKYGCTQDFITAYVVAAASGAIRVLFWA